MLWGPEDLAELEGLRQLLVNAEGSHDLLLLSRSSVETRRLLRFCNIVDAEEGRFDLFAGTQKMLLPRRYRASPANRSPSSDFAPMRLAAWLAIVLILSKGFSLDRTRGYWWVLDLSAASFCDVLFALGLGTVATLGSWAASRRPAISSSLRRAFVGICVLCVFYSVVAAGVFSYFRRPLSYDLLKLVHGVSAVESSILDRLTLPVVAALIGVPGGYYVMTRSLVRRRRAPVFMIAMLLVWSAFGCWLYYQRPKPYFMPHLAVNPHIELVRSTWNGVTGLGKPFLRSDYPREYRDEFKPRAWREATAGRVSQLVALEAPPKNVIVIVLESVGTKYMSLYGSSYNTTPALVEEAAHAMVFENFYAHVPYTFCSFMALNFSIYPGMPWCYVPERLVHPDGRQAFSRSGGRPLPQTLALLLKQHGVRTAFLSNGDLTWAGMSYVLENQGYDIVEDYRAMGGASLTSWGAEDRVLFERLIRFIDEKPGQPFYAFCWTDQTHDPYELGPNWKMIDFFGDRVPGRHADDLSRYLNVMRQVDQHLGALFRALRDRGLAEETLIVITGDHGEAFGDPHDQRGHGFTAYQEDVNVPLILWNPRLFSGGQRPDTIGGHVDLSATIAELLGIPAPEDWQGHSLFDPARPQRAYYLASIGEYLFGVRDGKWKYTYEATSRREFLTDLTVDPYELKNCSSSEPEICTELRNRVSAWVDFEDKFLRPDRD
jgi:arylsulfatase A-like enzyme